MVSQVLITWKLLWQRSPAYQTTTRNAIVLTGTALDNNGQTLFMNWVRHKSSVVYYYGAYAATTATATKTSLKTWISAASNFIALIPSHLKLLCQVLAIVLKCMNSKGLYQSSGKEKGSCCLVFPSSTKREFRHFHVVVVQRKWRNVQKSVMHVQSCCFAYLNLLLFAVLAAVAVFVA